MRGRSSGWLAILTAVLLAVEAAAPSVATAGSGANPSVTSLTDTTGSTISYPASSLTWHGPNGSVTVATNTVFASVTPGQTIVIQGSGFGSASPSASIQFLTGLGTADFSRDGQWSQIVQWTDTAITLQLTGGLPIGIYALQVQVPSGQESQFFELAVAGGQPAAVPAITGIAGALGNALTSAPGGGTVVLQGTNFGSTAGTVKWWPSDCNPEVQDFGAGCQPPPSPAITATTSWAPGAVATTAPSAAGQYLAQVVSASGAPSDLFPDTGGFTVTPPPPPPSTTYVVNAADDSLSVIDDTTNTVVDTISLNVGPAAAGAGSGVTAQAVGAVANREGTLLYVSVQFLGTTSVAGGCAIGTPYTWIQLFCDPANTEFTPRPGLVEVVDTNPASPTYNTVVSVIPVGVGPGWAALTPDGRWLYVPDSGGGAGYGPGEGSYPSGVTIVDTSKVVPGLSPAANAGAVVTTVALGPGESVWTGPNLFPQGMSVPLAAAASPDGKRIYVLDGGSYCSASGNNCPLTPDNMIAVLDNVPQVLEQIEAAPSAVAPFDVVSGVVELPPGDVPVDMLLSPDGHYLYLPIGGGQGGKVDVVDVSGLHQAAGGRAGFNSPTSPANYATVNMYTGLCQGIVPPSEGTWHDQKDITYTVIPQDATLSPNGLFLYVSDFMGMIYVINTSWIQPGDNLAPAWMQAEMTKDHCHTTGSWITAPWGSIAIGSQIPVSGSSPVVGGLLLGGEPNRLSVGPDGRLRVAQGGFNMVVQTSMPWAPALQASTAGALVNQLAVIAQPALNLGYNAQPPNTSPGNTLGPGCQAPCVSEIAVGQMPWDVVTVQPNISAGTTPSASGGSGHYRLPGYVDLRGYGWATKAIDKLVGAGDLQGVAAGHFGPGDPFTRGQYAIALGRLFHLAAPSHPASFTDVPAASSTYNAVEAVFPFLPSAGAGVFAPNGHLTQQVALAALVRVLLSERRLALMSSAQSRVVLSHVPGADRIAPSLRQLVGTAIADGMLAGFPHGAFDPAAVLTRAEGAVLLAAAETRVGGA